MIDTGKKDRIFYGYVIVLLSFIIMVMTGTVLYTFPVFFKPLLTEMGWTRATTSAAYSINTIFTAIIGVAAGRITDRLGPRLAVTASGLVIGAGYLLMSGLDNLWQFYLFYGVILSIGQHSASIPLQATVARWFIKRRGMMTGIIISALGICGLVVVPLASRFIDWYGWRNSYLILGGTALVVITIAAQFLKRDPQQIGKLPYGANETRTTQPNYAPIRELSVSEASRTRQFWMLSAMWFFHMFAINTIMVHIIAYATELGIPATNAAYVLSTIGGIRSLAGLQWGLSEIE